MRILSPYEVVDPYLIDSNIPEDDYASWAPGTTYAENDTVILGHRIYQAVQSNTGQDPSLDTNDTYWVDMGATNRWRAFDHRLGSSVSGVGGKVYYKVLLQNTLNSIALFGVDSTSIQIKVSSQDGSIIYSDNTYVLAYRDDVVNAWSYVYNEFSYKSILILNNLTLPAGAYVEFTARTNVGNPSIGEIFLGRELVLGDVLSGSKLGVVDYSLKERDDWGGVYLVKRPVTRTVTFSFACLLSEAERVQQIIEKITSRIAVYYGMEGEKTFGTAVAGVLRDYDLTLVPNSCEGTLEVESLT